LKIQKKTTIIICLETADVCEYVFMLSRTYREIEGERPYKNDKHVRREMKKV